MKFSNFFKNRDHILLLSILAFVLISSTSLATSKIISIKPKVQENSFPEVSVKEYKTYPSIPVLKTKTSFPIISAQAALAIDNESQIPLYEKNSDERLLPASTTKIMTALIAMNHFGENDILTVKGISSMGQRMGLADGETISVGNLLDGLLIASANDAAETLASNYPGGKEKFINDMNMEASNYRLTNTHFENPTGFDGGMHFSTAKDLVRIAEIAMRNPRFSQRVSIKNKTVKDTSGKIIHYLNNTNELLGSVPGVQGIKTGWTENARENLVTYIERDGKKILIAILGSSDRFGETKELIDWMFTSYEWQEVIYPN